MGAPKATDNPDEQPALRSSRISLPLSRYLGKAFPTRYATQVDMCTNGPSFPKHIPVATAKTAPTALTSNTLKSKK